MADYFWIFSHKYKDEKMKHLIIVIIIFAFGACSIFQPSQEQEQEQVQEESEKIEEVYVFDEVPEDEDKKEEEIKELEKEIDKAQQETKQAEIDVFDEPVVTQDVSNAIAGSKFFLQLGAFSNLKRAEKYVEEINNQVPFILSIIYNPENSLYTVRSSAYSTKEEVENVRTQLWNSNLFLDSFIITE